MKIKILLLGLFIFNALWAHAYSGAAATNRRRFKELDHSFGGKLEYAAAGFRRLILPAPRDGLAYQESASASPVQGDQKKSRAQQVLDKKEAAIHLKRGKAKNDRGDDEGALTEFREAVALDPENGEARLALAGRLLANMDWDGALSQYQEAARLIPNNADAHENIGLLLSRKGDHKGAIDEFREAIRLDPGKKANLQLLIEAEKFELAVQKPVQLTPHPPGPSPRQETSDDLTIIGLAILGFFSGTVFFIVGLFNYRKLLLFKRTPVLPIGRVTAGLTHVRGKAEGEQTLAAPISGQPCYFYKVFVQKYVSDSQGGRWYDDSIHADGVRFHIADATGEILVDPNGAECEVPQSGSRETGYMTSTGRPGDGAITTEGLSILDLSDYSPPKADPSLDHGKIFLEKIHPGCSGDRYQLTEFSIRPGRLYNVLGTCIENPHALSVEGWKLILKGQDEPTFLISSRDDQEEEQTLRQRAALYVFGGGGFAAACVAVVLILIKQILARG